MIPIPFPPRLPPCRPTPLFLDSFNKVVVRPSDSPHQKSSWFMMNNILSRRQRRQHPRLHRGTEVPHACTSPLHSTLRMITLLTPQIFVAGQRATDSRVAGSIRRPVFGGSFHVPPVNRDKSEGSEDSKRRAGPCLFGGARRILQERGI